MDATGTDRAVLRRVVGRRPLGRRCSPPSTPSASTGAVFIAPAAPFGMHRARVQTPFDEPLESYEGWAKYNRHYWLEHYRDFLEFFFSQTFTEPHSTKQIEDCVGWGLETTGETLALTYLGRELKDPDEFAAPVQPDHVPGARDPRHRRRGPAGVDGRADREGDRRGVRGARGLRAPPARARPGARQPAAARLHRAAAGAADAGRAAAAARKRALYVSSPIGLGHARRDIAIARELRHLHPDLEIDWLAQHPVTAALEAAGERVHPASHDLSNESRHIESESAEHDLHCFQAWRRMDEILVANFMVFHDLVSETDYDLWIADEGWEIDYYLHENPEQKRAAYAWLTDFVGWLPMPDGGEHEAMLTADYNAEMIEHIARYPRVRDRAIFVGNPEDIVPDTFGPDLPAIADWTGEHFDFAGYVTGFDPAELADRERLRAELGYAPAEQVCVVTVGGSGVGRSLLERVMAAFPEARRQVPGLRMIVVAGPRIDPASLPAHDGLEVRAFVPDLYRHLAACDLAVVQGGLTTSMELTANRRPFLYFPLRHHFEQNTHVRHRLGRYGAGRCMDFETATPEIIAAAIAEEIGREVDYLPVETGGAAVAAARIAELL